MLEVAGIDVFYGHIRALSDVTLRVEPGEVVALVGANGAGKTTTLRTISGLLRPAAGRVMLDGRRIDRLAPEEIVRLGVSHLPEGRGIFPSLTVEENLRMGLYTRRNDRTAWRTGTEQVTELFPRLRERWAQPAGTLSGGEQQMLALSRALLPGPRLLMVDELSLGLAPVVVQQLFRMLEEINRGGTTILLVEQYVNLALRVASRAYVLEKGRIALEGTPESLTASGALASSYLGGQSRSGSGRALEGRPVPAGPVEPTRGNAAPAVARGNAASAARAGVVPGPIPARRAAGAATKGRGASAPKKKGSAARPAPVRTPARPKVKRAARGDAKAAARAPARPAREAAKTAARGKARPGRRDQKPARRTR